MPGGFHPFHAGHYSLYKSALEAFPQADVYVAATNDTKTRPFPFQLKEKLAKLAGVAPGRFVQVKSPFKAEEITSKYDPNEDVLIFVRSEKDKTEQPKPGGTKKDGSPSYFQPWTGKDLQPFSKHAYIDYLPTVEFGPGIKSATEIRNAWPNLNDRQKTAMVMSLYPVTQKNQKLAQTVVKMLDVGMSGQQDVTEGTVTPIRSYLVMASRPGRGMYTDVDVLIKDTGTGKIVGHVTGRNAHPNMDNEMDIAHYELTLNKDGIGPDLKNGFEFEAYGDPNLRTKSGYQVYATDNSGKNIPKQKPKPRSDVGQKVVQLRPEQPKKPQGLSVFSQGNLEKAAQTAKDDDRDYGPGMELVSKDDWYAFLEKFFGKELLDVDSANEMGYTDWTDNGDIAFTSGEGSVADKKINETRLSEGIDYLPEK